MYERKRKAIENERKFCEDIIENPKEYAKIELLSLKWYKKLKFRRVEGEKCLILL